jgi:hypothetical protein
MIYQRTDHVTTKSVIPYYRCFKNTLYENPNISPSAFPRFQTEFKLTHKNIYSILIMHPKRLCRDTALLRPPESTTITPLFCRDEIYLVRLKTIQFVCRRGTTYRGLLKNVDDKRVVKMQFQHLQQLHPFQRKTDAALIPYFCNTCNILNISGLFKGEMLKMPIENSLSFLSFLSSRPMAVA